MMNILVSSATLGAIVGIILALTGAGGAILAIPLLLFVLHLSVEQAAPIALLAVGLSAAVGASIGLRDGIVRYRAAALIAAAGVVSTPVGLWFAHRVPSGPLTLLFAVVLAFVAARMFMQATANGPTSATFPRTTRCQLESGTDRFIWTTSCAKALALLGAGAGFLSGLLGVGGGFVIVPSLKKTTDASVQTIVATSLAVIALVSISGVASSAIAGRMNWQIGVPFAIGSMTGMLGGRKFASRLSGQRLQQGFALVAGLIAVGMVAKVGLSG